MLVVLALSVLALLVPARQEAESTRAETLRRLDELLRTHAAAGWSGVALVSRGGELVLARGYGFADFDESRANDEHTLFELASITKGFTAAAVVRLAQDGRLSLDESIAVHLPGVPPHSRAITLRQLLAHTSGIPRTNAGGRGDDLALAVVEYLGDGPHRTPGSEHEYWNGGYALLAGVIERASGLAYTDYVEETLLAPAGMRASGFTGDAELDAAHAALGRASRGPNRRALEHPYGDYGYQYRGMGGLVTSALDLFAWDRALASDVLLDAEHRRELFAEVRDGYALGWRIERALDGSPRQSHGGAVRGFVSELRRYPEHEACVAVLANHDDADARALADGLEALVLRQKAKRPPPKAVVLAPEELAAVAGSWVGTAGRLEVRRAPGVLEVGLEGAALLAAAGANERLDWEADEELFARRAVEIVEGIAQGNSEPLRRHMAKRIPASWPDHVRRTIWPAQLERRGAFRGARPLGTRTRGGRVVVLLVLDHERGPARARVEFGPAGLEILDWNGPTFLATGRLEPVRKDVFTLRLGEEPVRLDFELANGSARRLRFGAVELVRP